MSATTEQLEQAFAETFVSDYLRCRACDEKRIAAGGVEDICVPHNNPEDLLCPCGSLREAYECQNGEWVTSGTRNGDPDAWVVPAMPDFPMPEIEGVVFVGFSP